MQSSELRHGAGGELKLSSIVPRLRRNPEMGTIDGEHGIMTGQTRMGKSFLSKRIARFYPWTVVHDPKNRFTLGREWQHVEARAHTIDQLHAIDPDETRIAIYAPDRRELYSDRAREEFCSFCEQPGTFVLFDELASAAPSHTDFPPSMRYLYTQGAENAICVLGLTQEPIRVPSFCFTQATHHYCFYSANNAHRDKICGFMPIEPEDIGDLKKCAHRRPGQEEGEFLYWRNDMRGAVGPCWLES